MEYYAIYTSLANGVDPEKLIFEEQKLCSEALKTYKDGRFNKFRSRSEALKFVKNGPSQTQNQSQSALSIFSSIVKPPQNQVPIPFMEKSSFPSLKKQEYQVFRKEIEQNNFSAVYEMINTNPRYLVSSCDTPSILKEGPRYNALHVAAISNLDTMAKVILQTIENPRFVDVLYPNHPNAAEMTQFLLESYLNTPEKARGETPLHLASKFGAADVVKVLVSYPACKMTMNFDGLMPKDIICSRKNGKDDEVMNLKNEIEKALEHKFFVPVLRSTDKSLQPVIGEPFSATTMPKLGNDAKSPSMEIKAYAGPMTSEQADSFRRRWKTPPRLTPTTVPVNLNLSFSPNSSTRNSNLSEILSSTPKSSLRKRKNLIDDFDSYSEMDALNGNHKDLSINILSEDEKEQGFDGIYEDLLEDRIRLEEEQKELKKGNNFSGYRENPEQFNMEDTPMKPKIKNDSNSNHINHNLNGSLLNFMKHNSMNDSSMLCNGRTESSVGVTYLDESGSIYNSDNVFNSPSFVEKNIRLTDIDKGLETIGRNLAIEYNVEWKEYWDFLHRHIDIRSNEGLQTFENYFKQKEKQSELGESSMSPAVDESPIKRALNDSFGLSAICAGFNSIALNDDKPKSIRNGLMSPSSNISKSSLINSFSTSPQSFPLQNPFMCIEQSCRTFSRRLATSLESETVQDQNCYEKTLVREINKLNTTIESYKRDQRFNVVNFQKIHARYCYLLVSYLKENNVDVKYLRSSTPLMSKVYTLASQFASGGGDSKDVPLKLHALCLSKFLKNYIEKQDKVYSAKNVDTETSCVDAWNGPEIYECSCQFDGSFTSSKHRREIRKKLYNDISSTISSTPNTFDLWTHRSNANNDLSKSFSDNEDDEAFESCSDDDSDEYYTPPQSPLPYSSDDDDKIEFEESMENFEDQKEFNLFIKGENPSKIDDDVFNALGDDFNIDESKYPLVFKWYQTMKVIKSKKSNHSFHLRIFTPKLKFVA